MFTFNGFDPACTPSKFGSCSPSATSRTESDQTTFKFGSFSPSSTQYTTWPPKPDNKSDPIFTSPPSNPSNAGAKNSSASAKAMDVDSSLEEKMRNAPLDGVSSSEEDGYKQDDKERHTKEQDELSELIREGNEILKEGTAYVDVNGAPPNVRDNQQGSSNSEAESDGAPQKPQPTKVESEAPQKPPPFKVSKSRGLFSGKHITTEFDEDTLSPSLIASPSDKLRKKTSKDGDIKSMHAVGKNDRAAKQAAARKMSRNKKVKEAREKEPATDADDETKTADETPTDQGSRRQRSELADKDQSKFAKVHQ